jgi:hypothetical protein
MRRALAWLHGSFADFAESYHRDVRITPGASSTRGKKRCVPFMKITARIQGPERAHAWVFTALNRIGFDASRWDVRYHTINHNRVEFVEKNWSTFRTIACEPGAALPLQLAYDSYLKERLLTAWGIDLMSQSRNQELARQGSLTGVSATVDMERASDTAALIAILLLFPHAFAQYLRDVRSEGWSSRYMGRGSYAKFSSMGNGATFTMETALFAAACYAVGSKTISVYGDDIVCDTECVPQLRQLLRFLGFTMNQGKSFYDAPSPEKVITGWSGFRESCGADWLRGKWVTPFYLRSEPTCSADWHHLINGIATVGRPYGRLWHWAKEKLAMCSHIVPPSDDTRAGVHIDPSAIRERGIVRTSDCIPWYWALTPKTDGDLPKPKVTKLPNGFVARSAPEPDCTRPTTRIVRGIRAYLAWFMMFPRQRESGLSTRPCIAHGYAGAVLNRQAAKATVALERVSSRYTTGEPLYASSKRVYVPLDRASLRDHLSLWTDFVSDWDPRFVAPQRGLQPETKLTGVIKPAPRPVRGVEYGRRSGGSKLVPINRKASGLDDITSGNAHFWSPWRKARLSSLLSRVDSAQSESADPERTVDPWVNSR